jgi:hypothetical protein
VLKMRSVADLNAEIVGGLHRIPEDVDAIVGIPRSGTLAASLIALHLQRVDLYSYEGALDEAGEGLLDVNHLLLVDDTLRTGRTLSQELKCFQGYRRKITSLVVFASKKDGEADIVLARCAEPRVFEWNLWRSYHLPEIAVDMDGVLCTQPGREEREGEEYVRFLENANPRFLPRKPVRAVVTCRLEKFRPETERWLKRNKVEYGTLHMMDYPSHAARQAAGQHAAWKSKVYKESGALLFVESSEKQASRICKVGPVWCTENQFLFGGGR